MKAQHPDSHGRYEKTNIAAIPNTKTHIYVVTAQNSFYSYILDWDEDIQKVITSYIKKPAALLFLSPQEELKRLFFFHYS